MKRIYLGHEQTKIHRNPMEFGESLEEKLRRQLENKEPIESIAPLIYTDSKDGVRPEFDHRTDKQELALEAIDKQQKSELMKAKQEQTVKKEETNDE